MQSSSDRRGPAPETLRSRAAPVTVAGCLATIASAIALARAAPLEVALAGHAAITLVVAVLVWRALAPEADAPPERAPEADDAAPVEASVPAPPGDGAEEPAAPPAPPPHAPHPLDALREAGWLVFDEVGVDGAQVDHVIAGPAGVLTVVEGPIGRRRLDPEVLEATFQEARLDSRLVADALFREGLSVDVHPAVLLEPPAAPEVPGGIELMGDVIVLVSTQAGEWAASLGESGEVEPWMLDVVASVCARDPGENGAPAPSGASFPLPAL